MALTPEALATLAAAAELLNAAGLNSTQLLAYEFATTEVKGMAEQDPAEAEFFAVAAEYFFERPELLKSKHPGLYEVMGRIFRYDGFEKQS